MGFFSGLTRNGLLEVIGRMARSGAAPLASAAPDRQLVGEGLAEPSQPTIDPQRLAIFQALLAGNYGAASRVTEPLRRRRLAEQKMADQARDLAVPDPGAEPILTNMTGGDPFARTGDAVSRSPGLTAKAFGIAQPKGGKLQESDDAYDVMTRQMAIDPRGETVDAGLRVGESLSPQAGTVVAAAERQALLDKLSRGGGLNRAGYIPTERDEYVLARTMFAEAPNIPEDHQAIGWVTVNRARRPGFPSTIEDVVHQPGQYQIVREGSGTGRDSDHWTLFEAPERMTLTQRRNRQHAIKMARAIMSGEIPDPTGGALFFRSPSVPSGWFDRAVARKRLILAPYRSPSSDEGRHLYYWRSKPGGIDQ